MEAIRAIGLTYKNSDGSIGAISDATESDNNMLFYSKSEADAEIARLGIKYSNAKTSAEFFKSALEEANKINERLEAEVERCHKLALGILSGKEDMSKIQDIERILKSLSGGR
jgi:hypothetical protein